MVDRKTVFDFKQKCPKSKTGPPPEAGTSPTEKKLNVVAVKINVDVVVEAALVDKKTTIGLLSQQ